MRLFCFVITLTLLCTGLLGNAQPNPVNTIAGQQGASLIPANETRTTTAIANYLKANYNTDRERVQLLFLWIAHTFSYDVAHMYEERHNETLEEKISRPLKTHKGVCENYAAVFVDVCKKMGLNAHTILGYDKVNGVTSIVSHAWCTVYYNGAWHLFDPTWASGRIYKGQFVPKYDSAYYEASPKDMIMTHMPFDPMWQLSTEPIDNAEFKTGQVAMGKPSQNFSYPDSIRAYLAMDEKHQLSTELRRVIAASVNNALVYDRATYLKNKLNNIEEAERVDRLNAMITRYNNAATDYNKAIKQFNKFVDYRNRQFSPLMPDDKIQALLDSSANRLVMARDKMMAVKPAGTITDEMYASFNSQLEGLQKRIDEQQDFLEKYFKKNKLGRKAMFSNYTLMGIPVN